MSSEYDNIPTLTSIGSYIRLDTEFVSQDNHEKCSEYNKVPGEHSKIYELCLSLTGNLMNYEKLDFFEELNSYKCNYLNLWTYYQLSKFHEEEHRNIRTLVVKLWNESEKYDFCTNTEFFSYNTSSVNYIKAKRLYDYALNYYKLKNNYYDNDTACNSKEDEYIRKSNQLYTEIKAECEANKHAYQSYCKAYNVVKEIHPNDRLLELKCKKVEHESETSRVDGIGLSGDHAGHGSEEDTGTSSYGLHSTSGSHQAMATAVPILGFTGLGSMARNLLRRGRINGMNSHDEFTNELLEDTYDDQAHPGITETYIGYQAT
ncbi:PIR Superfamily Protein [Plasmodium ovale wallikeri]|uniref:PIR Superfamily Protein n=1 Tax=Plasmodium ovale wallikeri TaxID=864142 RepID=A0A1A9AMU5_PLAOA|nr:PIR Superfamily Protein [Plasmodium ovale wallikeri]SBT58397.1 PIR Superfamily Protein [Plasmodium ovale wallikeri]